MLKEIISEKVNEGMDKDCPAYQKLVRVMFKFEYDAKFGKIVEVGEGYRYEVEIKEGNLYFDKLEEYISDLEDMWISIDRGRVYLVSYDEGNNPDLAD